MVTPSQLTSAGRLGSKPLRRKDSVNGSRSRSTGTKVAEDGTAIPASASRWRFHSCVAGWSTSKTRTGPADR